MADSPADGVNSASPADGVNSASGPTGKTGSGEKRTANALCATGKVYRTRNPKGNVRGQKTEVGSQKSEAEERSLARRANYGTEQQAEDRRGGHGQSTNSTKIDKFDNSTIRQFDTRHALSRNHRQVQEM
jgi:hypothetical protein